MLDVTDHSISISICDQRALLDVDRRQNHRAHLRLEAQCYYIQHASCMGQVDPVEELWKGSKLIRKMKCKYVRKLVIIHLLKPF